VVLLLQNSSLSISEEAFISSLRNTLVRSRVETQNLDEYYEGAHKLEQLGLQIPPELESFSVVLNWPRVTVDAVERRLDVQGFRGGDGKPDPYLWDVWQYNNMDERATFAHTDALALKRSYVCIGTNERDRAFPLITVESPYEMIALRDARTHRVVAALRSYDPKDGTGEDQRLTLYMPNYTRWLVRDGSRWVDEFERDNHNLGSVPVVPLVNRNRATRRLGASVLEGVSEMKDIIPIADSASRALTGAQLLQETMIAPARGVLGATKGDFVDQDGNQLSAWQSYFGAVWALSNKDAKTFQFDAADMKNIETIVNVYARLASGVASLPVEYYGLNTENPPSADGQRAGETRLIKNAERKQTTFGHSWETVQRFVQRFRTGSWDLSNTKIETIWRDAGTPTVAQVTDAVVKRFQVGLVDWETAQERMGESPASIDQMRERRQADIESAFTAGVQRFVEEV
jgi:hypothetical protein